MNNQEQSATLRVTWDGRTDEIRLDDVTAAEAGLFRRHVGISLRQAFEDIDVDTMAGLVWLVRRRENSRLTYEQVARSFTYADLAAAMEDTLDDDSAVEGPDDPEA